MGQERRPSCAEQNPSSTEHRPVITGQRVAEEKVIRARELRREMTPQENLLWGRLRGSHLGVNFRRQQIIGGFIADFYCHSARLAVEVDGAVHDAEYDRERDRTFAEQDIQVVRFTNDQVEHQMPWVLARIRQHLTAPPQAKSSPPGDSRSPSPQGRGGEPPASRGGSPTDRGGFR